MAMLNQMIPLSGQPKRFSFDMETNEKTTQVMPRNTISHRLKAIIVSVGCTRPTYSWWASVSLLAVRLAVAYRVLGLGSFLSSLAGKRFMILLPGGGCLFEITSSPLGPL